MKSLPSVVTCFVGVKGDELEQKGAEGAEKREIGMAADSALSAASCSKVTLAIVLGLVCYTVL